VSLTLPKRTAPYTSTSLFPCFVALLAEGALADLQCRTLRLDERDLFGRLLKTCSGDVIGSLRIEEILP
jgi:serine/threonine-protein kinase HipA